MVPSAHQEGPRCSKTGCNEAPVASKHLLPLPPSSLQSSMRGHPRQPDFPGPLCWVTEAPGPYTYCFLEAELLGRLGDFWPLSGGGSRKRGALEEASLSSVVRLAQFCSLDESPL